MRLRPIVSVKVCVCVCVCVWAVVYREGEYGVKVSRVEREDWEVGGNTERCRGLMDQMNGGSER